MFEARRARRIRAAKTRAVESYAPRVDVGTGQQMIDAGAPQLFGIVTGGDAAAAKCSALPRQIDQQQRPTTRECMPRHLLYQFALVLVRPAQAADNRAMIGGAPGRASARRNVSIRGAD